VFYPAQGRKLSTEQSLGVETERVLVQDSDIIIMATDGLWDNLTTDDVLRIVSHQINGYPSSSSSSSSFNSGSGFGSVFGSVFGSGAVFGQGQGQGTSASARDGRPRDSQGSVLPFSSAEVAKKLVEEAYRMNLKPDDITTIVAVVRTNT